MPPQRSLSLLDSVAVIIAVIVGIGIFETAPTTLSLVSSPAVVLGLWLLGGMLSLAGALYDRFQKDIKVIYDRKEEKDHAERGRLVGIKPKDGDSVLVIEDVITAGTTTREVVPFLHSVAKLDIRGWVIVVDRCERGAGDKSATQELADTFGITTYPLLTIYEIRDYLFSSESGKYQLSPELQEAVDCYLSQYAG